MNLDIPVNEQVTKMNEAKLLDLLPENLAASIQKNLKKYNFINYKLAEEMIEKDLLGSEIELLKGKQKF